MNYLDRRNKIDVLQERAALYNSVQDELVEQELPEEVILKETHKALDDHTQAFAKTAPILQYNTLSKTHPKPLVSVLTTSALISLGLDNYPTMTTQSQDFNRVAENNYNHYKELKQRGQLRDIIEPKIRQIQQDEQTQAIIFKADHLKEYEDKTHQGFKESKSQYKRDHNYNDGMNEICHKMTAKNHLMKNDLNTFFDAYIKHKSTLRGVPKKLTK